MRGAKSLMKPKKDIKGPRLKKAIVLSRNMDKTAIVLIEGVVKHSFYKKLVRKRSKFKIHDPKNETNKGDIILISETRPISAEKHWRLVKILKKAVEIQEALL